MNINDLSVESVKAGLRELLKRLRADKEQIETKIKQYENDLIALGDTTVGIEGKRRKWGSNKQLIEVCLKSSSLLPLSVTEIAKQVGIPRSSVRVSLLRLKETNRVEELPDGTWKIK